jgi:hypothetical protein
MVPVKRTSPRIRVGEKIERGWGKILQWDMHNTRILLRHLERLNRGSKRSVTESGGPVVSLTTYGARIDSVYLTLESIAAGHRRPSRLILWLDDERRAQDLPDELKRLQLRGLEIRSTLNYGPFTKFYPYLLATGEFTEPLATADDDTIYSKGWLRGLARSYQTNTQLIHCYRAHEIRFTADALASYTRWGRCRTNQPGYHHFLTGASGCIYPPAFLERLKVRGEAFRDVCPKADDIWLNVNALRFGYKVKQVYSWQRTFPLIPGTQNMGLAITNVHASQNDVQMMATYSKAELDFLRTQARQLSD